MANGAWPRPQRPPPLYADGAFVAWCVLMAYWIVVQCLVCGHTGTLSEKSLPRFGEKPDAPIAKFVKRLTCEECGSRSVKAWREERPAA